MNYTGAQTLSPEQFKRRFGVHPKTFKQMIAVLKPLLRPKPKPGAKPKLALEERVLVALEYWREYRTYFHIGSSWGMSEASVCRIVHWVEDALIGSGQVRLPGKKQLVQGFGNPSVDAESMLLKRRLSVPSDINANSIPARRNDIPSSVS